MQPFFKKSISVQACGKAWIFERVPGFELSGYDDRIEKGISTRMECQELCLKDKALPCRSAEYDYTTLHCRLSSQTRRTQPAAYRYVMRARNAGSESQISEIQIMLKSKLSSGQYSDIRFSDIWFLDRTLISTELAQIILVIEGHNF